MELMNTTSATISPVIKLERNKRKIQTFLNAYSRRALNRNNQFPYMLLSDIVE